MRRFAALIALAALTGAPASAAGPELSVTTSLAPAAARYADPVMAVAEVHYAKDVEGSSIRVVPSFTPFVLTAKPVVQPVGDRVVRISYSLLCVTEGCLPTGAKKVLHLHPLTVTALASGARVSATAAWPPLRIDSRLRAPDLKGEASFRSPKSPPPPRYGVAPGTFAGVLIAGAAICVLAAIGLAAAALRRRRKRAVTRRASPLELAIAYVRDATGRPSPDRRRALELLSEAVADDLALDAADAAWSREPPTPAGAGELADRAEAQL
jgi:hypothetical protein